MMFGDNNGVFFIPVIIQIILMKETDIPKSKHGSISAIFFDHFYVISIVLN